jgi:thimet oligopeptidase
MNVQGILVTLLGCGVIFGFKQAGAQERELPLDRLTPADVRALVDSSIVSATVYRDSLLAVRGRRTVQNTLRLYDEMSIRFNVAQIVPLLSRMHPDSTVRTAAAEGVRRRDTFSTGLRLDPRIYRALLAVDTTPADAETRYYLRRVLALYRHDGVDRDSATRARLAALDDEATRLEQRFAENLRQDTTALGLPDTGTLSGLPPDWINAQRRGPAGEVLVRPEDLRFVLQNADDPGVRLRALQRITNLAPRNHFVVDSMLHVREQIAALLGYPTYAAFQFHDYMAGTPSQVHQFLDDLQRITEPAVQRDVARAESLLGRPPVLGDQQYVTYHLHGRAGARPNALRPYFPYEGVRDALLHIADTLFGLQFTAARDLPVWYPDVEAYRVSENGKLIGIAYLDLRRRPGKPAGNATASLRLGVRDRVIRRTAITMSLPPARPGEPVLLGGEAVASLFHEFGHLLENLIVARRWFGTSGLPAEFDFREIPSIVFERWGRDARVLRTFARHYRTGEPLPDSLVSALHQPDESRVGLGVRGLLARARISLALHERPGGIGDIDSIVQAQVKASVPIARPAGESHQETSFTHLVGYEAAYYTYLWDAVIAEDILSRFTSGLMDPVTTRAYRRAVLDPGRSQPADSSIAHFLGRPFKLDAWAATLGVK